MYCTWVILRHTFREAIVQPIYSLLLALGAAILIVFRFLPFFTLGEDTTMFASVGLDIILLLVLIATLFATSRSVFEEIEDRTMLTLMSKPVQRWEVLTGKYLGIILAALLAVALLGTVLCLAVWWRIPTDYMISTNSLDDRDHAVLYGYRIMHIAGIIPSLIQVWLEIASLAAVGVALSTRVSLVVNLPVVIFIYIAGNLTRFLYPLLHPAKGHAAASVVVRTVAYLFSIVLPYLEAFDLRPLAIYSRIQVAQFATDQNATSLWTIWGYLAISTAYAIAYATFALCVGMWLFQTRELGGPKGRSRRSNL